MRDILVSKFGDVSMQLTRLRPEGNHSLGNCTELVFSRSHEKKLSSSADGTREY